MAPLPTPINHTTSAIYEAKASERAKRGSWEGLGISISILGEECERKLWYEFRWTSKPEVVDGLKAITFETGEIEEERLLNDLELIGCVVERVDPTTGKQRRFTAAHGHIRGKSDGKAWGIIEAPKTPHAVECKSAANKYFGPIVKKGVKAGYFSHYVQATTYAYLDGLEGAFYMCRNKDSGAIHTERLKVDPAESIRLLARAERIVFMQEPAPREHEDPTKKTAFKCGYCRHKAICHDGGFPRVNCRTCVHATPLPGGDALWNCARWGKPLSADEQRQGCPAHLFIPKLIPGEVVEVDEDAERITYTLARDGSTWVDGSKEAEIIAAEAEA